MSGPPPAPRPHNLANPLDQDAVHEARAIAYAAHAPAHYWRRWAKHELEGSYYIYEHLFFDPYFGRWELQERIHAFMPAPVPKLVRAESPAPDSEIGTPQVGNSPIAAVMIVEESDEESQ